MQIELTYKIATAGLKTYLKESKDSMMKLFLEHEKIKKPYSATKEATKFLEELGIDETHYKETDSVTKKGKEIKNFVKKARKRADPLKMGTETAA